LILSLLNLNIIKALFWETHSPFSIEITYENVLATIVEHLDKQPTSISDWVSFDIKLELIGYSIGTYEEDAYIWINYPDGALEINEDDIGRLNKETNAFLKFKLEKLKQQRIKYFKPNDEHSE
jgi:hypothetical protein